MTNDVNKENEVKELADKLRDRDYSRTPPYHLARFILNERYRKQSPDSGLVLLEPFAVANAIYKVKTGRTKEEMVEAMKSISRDFNKCDCGIDSVCNLCLWEDTLEEADTVCAKFGTPPSVQAGVTLDMKELTSCVADNYTAKSDESSSEHCRRIILAIYNRFSVVTQPAPALKVPSVDYIEAVIRAVPRSVPLYVEYSYELAKAIYDHLTKLNKGE